MRCDRAVVVELGLVASLVTGYVIVEVDPQRLRGRSVRLQERVVLDVLAVVLKRDVVLYSLIPQMAGLLVGKRFAAVGGVVAEPVRRLDVVGVRSHGLRDPVVTVSRLAARVVVVVQQREALHDRVRVGRYNWVRCVGRVVAEGGQGGVAVAGSHVAQDLIVGAVFTDDQEDVLDQRRGTDLARDRDRRGSAQATGGRFDIGREIPVVVLGDLRRISRQGRARNGNGNDAHGAEVLVGVQVGRAEFIGVRIFESIRRRWCYAVARGADALVVGNEQLTIRRVEHDRTRSIADRDQALDLVCGEAKNGNRVGIVERDVGKVVHRVDCDRVRPHTNVVTGHADRQPKLD